MAREQLPRRVGPRFAGIQILGDMPNRVQGFQLGIIEGDVSLKTLNLPYGELPYGPIMDHLKCSDEVALLIGESGAYFGHTLSQATATIGVHIATISPKAFDYYREVIPEREDVPHLLARLLAWDRHEKGRENSIFNWFEAPQYD